MDSLIEKIRTSIIGDRTSIQTPFGEKPLIYADYTASGRSLTFIEEYIRESVLPYYANTHTETSFTGAQTTALREEALPGWDNTGSIRDRREGFIGSY